MRRDRPGSTSLKVLTAQLSNRPYFEICFAYQGAGPDKLQMSTTVKSFFLITFKTLSKVLHTHASRQGKRKKSMALEEGSNSNISLLLQIPLVTDKGKDILHV